MSELTIPNKINELSIDKTQYPIRFAITRNALDWLSTKDFDMSHVIEPNKRTRIGSSVIADDYLKDKIWDGSIRAAFEGRENSPYFGYPAAQYIFNTFYPEKNEKTQLLRNLDLNQISEFRSQILLLFQMLLGGTVVDPTQKDVFKGGSAIFFHPNQGGPDYASNFNLLMRHVFLQKEKVTVAQFSHRMAEIVLRSTLSLPLEEIDVQVFEYNKSIQTLSPEIAGGEESLMKTLKLIKVKEVEVEVEEEEEVGEELEKLKRKNLDLEKKIKQLELRNVSLEKSVKGWESTIDKLSKEAFGIFKDAKTKKLSPKEISSAFAKFLEIDDPFLGK